LKLALLENYSVKYDQVGVKDDRTMRLDIINQITDTFPQSLKSPWQTGRTHAGFASRDRIYDTILAVFPHYDEVEWNKIRKHFRNMRSRNKNKDNSSTSPDSGIDVLLLPSVPSVKDELAENVRLTIVDIPPFTNTILLTPVPSNHT
jgi:hypothetical protein